MFISAATRWYFHHPTNRHKPRFSGGSHIWSQRAHNRNHSVASNRSFVSYHNLRSTVKRPTTRRKQERLWSFALLCPSYAWRGVYYYLCTGDISSVGTDSYPGTTARLNCTGRTNRIFCFLAFFLTKKENKQNKKQQHHSPTLIFQT